MTGVESSGSYEETDMKFIRHYIGLVGVVLVLFVSPLLAESPVEKGELKSLITGKTLEGRWILWDSNYRMYMDPSGELKRVYGKGTDISNQLDGTWWINKKGKLCLEVENRTCRRVKRRDDGGYNLYNKNKELKQTIEKIVDGNPYNL